MSKRKKAGRRASSHILHAVARTIEYGCFMGSQLLDDNEGSVIAREGPLKRCLTDKEVVLIDQRLSKCREMVKDLRVIANHLRKSSV